MGPWATSPKIRPTALWVVRGLAGHVLGNEKKKEPIGASLVDVTVRFHGTSNSGGPQRGAKQGFLDRS